LRFNASSAAAVPSTITTSSTRKAPPSRRSLFLAPGAGRLPGASGTLALPLRSGAVGDLDPLEQERRAARLAAAGAVGASVAHELRNALAVAESALFLARRDVDDRPRLLRHLDQVGQEIRKAHAVIGSVLGLARGEPVRRETASVGTLVDVARHAL